MANACLTLIAFFRYNTDYVDRQSYLYQEFSAHYIFNIKKWEQQPYQKGFAISCIYYCNLFIGEKYYLQMLLTIIQGLQSFNNICTIVDMQYTTFKAACTALGLLEDDCEWIDCFIEVVRYTTGIALWTLFMTVLIYGIITNLLALWN